MNDVEEIDRAWRDGLASVAEDFVSTPNPRVRVAAHVKRRRRSRVAVVATVSIALAAAVVVTFGGLGSHSTRVRVVSPPDAVAAVVQVDDAPGARFALAFPGRKTVGNPPSVALPSGLIRFVIHGLTPGHQLVIDGVPDFVADFERAGTIVQEVRLNPGDYLMHCAVPGHKDAGEETLLVVR